MRSLLLAAVLSGCGGSVPDFTGVWKGPLASASTCSGNYPSPAHWTITDLREGTLTVAMEGACDSLTADVDGSVAIIRAKTCATTVYTGGRLALLAEDRLDVLLQATNTAAGCDVTFTGVLNLE
jgi:hypothetical protein